MIEFKLKYDIKVFMSKEIIKTSKKIVSCNGQDESANGHPKVWLKIKETGTFIDCPYCERRFSTENSKTTTNEQKK